MKCLINGFFFFFEQSKLDYINTVIAVLSAQGVPKRLLEKIQAVHKNYNKWLANA